jgi:hypothetical protein
MQSSHRTSVRKSPDGTGMPHPSQTIPLIKGKFRQHAPQSA